MSAIDRDSRLDAAIAAYYREVEAGHIPDREAFLAEHADLRTELESFLADKAAFERRAAVVSDATMPPAPPGADAPAPSLGIVRYFGDYELLEEIARGGMGVVFRARQASLNRTVALKMIMTGQLASLPTCSGSAPKPRPRPTSITRTSCRSTKSVNTKGSSIFRMKLIAGGSLAERMKESSPGHEMRSAYLPPLPAPCITPTSAASCTAT